MKAISSSIIVLAGAYLWHGSASVGNKDGSILMAIPALILLLSGFTVWIRDKGTPST